MGSLADFSEKAARLAKLLQRLLFSHVASDVLHLLRGTSHDRHGHPQKQNVIDSASAIRLSGGDW